VGGTVPTHSAFSVVLACYRMVKVAGVMGRVSELPSAAMMSIEQVIVPCPSVKARIVMVTTVPPTVAGGLVPDWLMA
jgi:hypothetical protein